CQQHKVYPVTF
nr:immunoglobulin light chain junction region [Macaca mulatta]MOX56427.1 immunoglobulin light chain junction region [Macaca mulatta]MOX56671.1 immunoglobulin light chain junction region [Macaca mulatta]MOX57525.1 immunoglobulin light chain junction region [Macaca mulatta]